MRNIYHHIEKIVVAGFQGMLIFNRLKKILFLAIASVLFLPPIADARLTKKELVTHDPQIFKWVSAKQYDKIPMKQWYNMQIGIIMLSFSQQKCYSNNPLFKQKAWNLKSVILNMATAGSTRRQDNPDALGVLLLPDILARHSAYYATARYITKWNGCDSPRVQKTLQNLIDLIIYRDPARVRARHKKRREHHKNIDYPLTKQKINRIVVDRGPLNYYKDKRKEKIFREMIDRVSYGDDSMLICEYSAKTGKRYKGPTKVDPVNITSFGYTFWYERVPITEEELKIVPGIYWWRNMGVIALKACPETRLEAERIRENNWSKWKYSKRWR